VSVIFSDGSWPDGFRRRVLRDLQAGLASRDIGVCSEASEPEVPPLAVVRIVLHDGNSVGVTVDIRDALTEKRVSRDIDLSHVPSDGRAFAIAIATDELVWASWAELGLERSRRRAVPPEVAHGVEEALPAPPRRQLRLGARAALERFAGGQTHIGGDGAFGFGLGRVRRLHGELSAGLREGLITSAPHGDVLASAAGFGATLRYTLVQAPRAELAVAFGARAAWVRLQGRAIAGAIDDELAGWAIYTRAGVTGAVRITGPLWLELGAGAGAPLRALEATDANTVVTGVSGVELPVHVALFSEL
jgi:hypothetical protein